MDGEDPWFWDIDRVVAELCTESQSWVSDAVKSRRRPNFTNLEVALREQEIDGSTLLTAVDDAVLKNELGIKVLGQLAPVKQIIWDLRQESTRYREWLGRYGSEISLASYNLCNFKSISNVRKRSQSPPLQIQTLQVSSRISANERDDSERHLTAIPKEEASTEQHVTSSKSKPEAWVSDMSGSKRRKLDTEVKSISSNSREHNNFERGHTSDLFDGQSFSANEPAAAANDTVTAIPKIKDQQFTAPNIPSKQRKRIAPTLVTSEISLNRHREIPTEADAVINNDPHNIEPGVIYMGDDGKKRLVPVLQSGPDLDLPRRHQEQMRNQALANTMASNEIGERDLQAIEQTSKIAQQDQNISGTEALSVGYLGKKKIPVNDIFYTGIGVGKDIISTDDTDEELNLFSHGTVSDGRRRYVSGIMRGYLRAKRQQFYRDGKYYSAIRPYPTRLAPMNQPPSFTLLHKEVDGEVHATRQIASHWPEIDYRSSQTVDFEDYDNRQACFDLPDNILLGGLSSYDNWDPDLLEKYRYVDGGDVVLPLYGDSDEEGEYDNETWKEIEEERGTLDRPLLPVRGVSLNSSDVNAAIDEGIAQIVVAWQARQVKRLPKLQHDAWKLWKNSRNKFQNQVLRQRAEAHIDRINNQRLPQMREKILENRWGSKKQVLRETKIMEASVFDREDRQWELSVIASKQEPEKPSPQKRKALTSNRLTFVEDDDGECIMTDTETQGFDDEDDFIDDEDDFIDDAAELETVGHDRADDEADESSISDEDNSNELTRGSGTTTKACRNLGKKLFNRKLPWINDQVSENELTAETVPIEEDEKGSFLDSDISSSPRLPLRPAGDENRRIQLGKNTSLNKQVASSQEDTPEIIDLTMLTSETSMEEKSQGGTQPINLITPEKRKNKLRISFKHETTDPYASSDLMEVSPSEFANISCDYIKVTDPAAIAGIPRWKGEEAGDRNQLLIGEIFRIMPSRREQLADLFSQLTLNQMWTSMVDVMHAFRDGKDRVPGIDPKTYTGLTGVMRLFEMYAVGTSRRNRKKLEPNEIELILEKEESFGPFHQICLKTFDDLLGKVKEICDNEDDGENSDVLRANRRKSSISCESEVIIPDIPHKTRKKKIFENAQARDLRQHHQQRQLEQDERRRILRDKMEQDERRRIIEDKLAGIRFTVPAGQKRIIINDAKHEDQGFVYVHEQISQRIKEHQIDGVRFMWSQIVTSGDIMQGCLLAHTMGLGKTMQVITLLVAIAEAAKSPDQSISSQIPPSLRVSKTLVLCPPGLIDNWMDELLMWAPQGILGQFRKFDSSLKAKDIRLGAIQDWYSSGGILIMSYEMFRKLVHNTSTQKQAASLSKEEHAQVREHLLRGPNIIIADEAHRMKNANASITQAAVQFRSSSRIALTGSPLANNVVEYHTMIEWIAPNYLGPITEFRAKYVEPIQQGSYSESTASERRQSLKMLSVLRKDLEPKVHRADISVLRKDLKPKKEFVITVPLTKLQHKAYSIYVKSMLNNNHEVTKDGQVQLSTLWHWLAILSLLCNHPACFKAKLSERKDHAEKKLRDKSKLVVSTSEDEDGPGNVSVWKVGVSEELVRKEMDLFKQFGAAVEELYSSNKVKLLLQILDASKAVGDKVLIFSHSIATLDFLERLCKETSRRYARLDGSTKMSSRQGLIKGFNTDDTELYLISTTAGGIGLNLPGANRVIIFDFKFNPVNEEQAVGRAYRIGQQKPVFVYRFVAGGTFEECIHNTTVFKMQLASKVVDKKNPLAWAKKRTGEFLFEPRVVNQQDLSGFKSMDPLVLDKILDSQVQDSTIRAIVMTDTFERHDNEVLTAEDQKEVMQQLSDEKLKRSDKPAWEALLRKRALATSRISTPVQTAQVQRQNLNTSASSFKHPAGSPRMSLPGIQPTSSLPSRTPENGKTRTVPKTVIPELTPVAGANTKIRDSTSLVRSVVSEKGF